MGIYLSKDQNENVRERRSIEEMHVLPQFLSTGHEIHTFHSSIVDGTVLFGLYHNVCVTVVYPVGAVYEVVFLDLIEQAAIRYKHTFNMIYIFPRGAMS